MATIKVPIEVDITYVNKTWYNARKKGSNEQHYVIGICQRNGDARIEVLANNSADSITEAMLRCVAKGCIIYAEKNILPLTLSEFYEIIELQDGKHSNGDVHVNHVKNMWKDLKRVIKQTHIHVSKKHLQLYCDEVVWQTNHRHLSTMDKFNLLLSAAANPVAREKSKWKNLTK